MNTKIMNKNLLIYLNNLNGWQRLWLLLSVIFSIIYCFIFLILPVSFDKTYAYALPFSRDLSYEHLDFPSYSRRYSISSHDWIDTTTYHEATSKTTEWLSAKYPNLIDKTLVQNVMGKGCFGEQLIDYVYLGDGIFKPIIFKIYNYRNFRSDYIWESLNELPTLRSHPSECWIGIHINTSQDKFFIFFYRPFNVANNSETIEIADYLRSKSNNLLSVSRFYWFVKFLFFSAVFSLLIYLVGSTFAWLIKGFK